MTEFVTRLGRALTADWRPAVEILALAIIVYAVFRFMRGTRGAGVLRPVFFAVAAALAVLLIAAQAAGLDRLVWVAERLVALAAIGALVIFQPEIRSGLVRVGRGRVFNVFVAAPSPVAEEVVRAVTRLSIAKLGALVAVERGASLAKYARGGVGMDARVSADLLVSLFAAGAPLRDGAAIVRGGKVAAAGCLLPLSRNIELSRSLGTRHRAGLGLTEQTDAFTVIVSDGTGRISLAVGGGLTQDVAVGSLRGIVEGLCAEAEVASAASPAGQE